MLRPMALSSTDPKTLGPTAPAQAARWVLSAAATRRSRAARSRRSAAARPVSSSSDSFGSTRVRWRTTVSAGKSVTAGSSLRVTARRTEASRSPFLAAASLTSSAATRASARSTSSLSPAPRLSRSRATRASSREAARGEGTRVLGPGAAGRLVAVPARLGEPRPRLEDVEVLRLRERQRRREVDRQGPPLLDEPHLDGRKGDLLAGPGRLRRRGEQSRQQDGRGTRA